jgi:hypothetical protein
MQAKFPWIVVSIFPFISILDLHEKYVHHWKKQESLVYENNVNFCIYFYLYAIFALEEIGNIYEPVCMYLCVPQVEADRNICILND